jgi:hypothetical protein
LAALFKKVKKNFFKSFHSRVFLAGLKNCQFTRVYVRFLPFSIGLLVMSFPLRTFRHTRIYIFIND